MDAVTGNPKIDFVLSIIGALVPVFSALASFFNHFVREQTSRGEKPNGVMLAAGAVLNVASVNIDKGVQFVKMATGKEVPHTDAEPKSDA
jgi:hypothetical protein